MAGQSVIDLSNWLEFKVRFKDWSAKRSVRVLRALSSAAELVLYTAQGTYLSGMALKVKSGRLRSSVTKRPATGAYRAGNTVYVQVGTNVHYGKAWEYGYTVPPTVIYPKKARVLRFLAKGEAGQHYVFARYVYRPEYHVEARPWLEPAYKDNRVAIRRMISSAVGWQKKGAKK